MKPILFILAISLIACGKGPAPADPVTASSDKCWGLAGTYHDANVVDSWMTISSGSYQYCKFNDSLCGDSFYVSAWDGQNISTSGVVFDRTAQYPSCPDVSPSTCSMTKSGTTLTIDCHNGAGPIVWTKA